MGRRSTLVSSPPLFVNDSEAPAVQLLMQSLLALLVRRLLLVSLPDPESILVWLIVVLQLKLVKQQRMLSMQLLASRGLPQQLLPP